MIYLVHYMNNFLKFCRLVVLAERIIVETNIFLIIRMQDVPINTVRDIHFSFVFACSRNLWIMVLEKNILQQSILLGKTCSQGAKGMYTRGRSCKV